MVSRLVHATHAITICTAIKLRNYPGVEAMAGAWSVPGARKATREILFPPTPNVAEYRVRERTIEVMRIYHGGQDRP